MINNILLLYNNQWYSKSEEIHCENKEKSIENRDN